MVRFLGANFSGTRAIAVAATLFLSSCGGLPGPGMVLDVAARNYGSSKATEYEAAIARKLSSKEDTRKLSPKVVYTRGLETNFLPKYVVMLFGNVKNKDTLDKVAADIPMWIDIDSDYCEVRVANVMVGGF